MIPIKRDLLFRQFLYQDRGRKWLALLAIQAFSKSVTIFFSLLKKEQIKRYTRTTSPQIGTINPAPTEIVMSLIFIVKSVGAPLIAGSPVSDKEVLAIQTGSLSNP